MITTANYGLKKPEGTDVVNIQDFNDNSDVIDEKLKLLASIGVPYGGTTTGSANTYAISSPVITALAVGQPISIKFNVASTGASTLNWCGLGAKGIKKPNGSDATNLKTGIYTLRYDGTNFILQGEGASGNAISTDLLPGKTASTDAGDIAGAMPTKATATYTPSALNQTISALQYLLGAQTILGDADLVSANIKAGANIFGVAGSGTVVDTRDAVLDPAYLLSGYSGYDDGVKKAGTMPNHSGADSPANSIAGTGTNRIYVRPQQGYYDGNVASYVDDGNFNAANIVSGKSILGLWGNANIQSLGGKRFVSGSMTIPANAPYKFFPKADGSDGSDGAAVSYPITITGFDFKPTIAITYHEYYGMVCVVFNSKASYHDLGNRLIYLVPSSFVSAGFELSYGKAVLPAVAFTEIPTYYILIE